jgi:BirA family biotin operon repressor/biotin-[acetyl-CoA-carboxylase] ligase
LFVTSKFQDFEIREFEILDSTNLHAKLIADEAPDKLVIVANNQTSGKGRGGKEWFSDEGNLFFSIILEVNKIKDFELISLISAFTISEIIDDLGANTKIKWPNDVLINDKKFSGILLEKYKNKLIIGIGINTVSSPEFLDGKKSATNLLLEKILINNQDFLYKFLTRFSLNIKKFNNEGFLGFLLQINARLYKKNEMAELDYLGKKYSGKVLHVAENGNLVLSIENKDKQFNIGEIL